MAKKTSSTRAKTTSTKKGLPRAVATPRPTRTPRSMGVSGGGGARNDGQSRHGQRGPEISVLSHEQIAQRAYQIWQQTGNPNESQNWDEAQRQLRAEFGIQ